MNWKCTQLRLQANYEHKSLQLRHILNWGSNSSTKEMRIKTNAVQRHKHSNEERERDREKRKLFLMQKYLLFMCSGFIMLSNPLSVAQLQTHIIAVAVFILCALFRRKKNHSTTMASGKKCGNCATIIRKSVWIWGKIQLWSLLNSFILIALDSFNLYFYWTRLKCIGQWQRMSQKWSFCL